MSIAIRLDRHTELFDRVYNYAKGKGLIYVNLIPRTWHKKSGADPT